MTDIPALERAVIEAAERWRDELRSPDLSWVTIDALEIAIDALRAARNPPDPIAALIAAASSAASLLPTGESDALLAAVERVEAQRDRRGRT